MRLTKTETGQAAFKERSPLLSQRQRAMFLLFDGKRTVADILAAAGGMGMTADDVKVMVQEGFLTLASAQSDSTAAEPAVADVPLPLPLSDQQRYQSAKPLATQLTATLGLRGFMLNLAVESAAGYPELLALFPKIQAAVGSKACQELERALKG